MSTHAYDAVDDAVRMLARQAPMTREHRLVKSAVVMITDGFPVGDTVSPDTVIQRANASGHQRLRRDACLHTRACSRLSSGDAVADATGCQWAWLSARADEASTLTKRIWGRFSGPLPKKWPRPTCWDSIRRTEKRNDGKLHTIRIEGPAGHDFAPEPFGIPGWETISSRQVTDNCAFTVLCLPPSGRQYSSSSSSSSTAFFFDDVEFDGIEADNFQLHSTLFTVDNLAFIRFDVDMDIAFTFGTRSGRHF
mgnify:CR=1 FL=1